MAVNVADLTTPEQGQPLATRQRRQVATEAREDPAAELAALRARIEAARTIEPSAKERHCLDCYTRGRNAAIKAIEGG